MTRRFGLIYTLFSLIVLIVLTLLVIARLGNARSSNLAEAEASFRRLQSQLVATADERGLSPVLREYSAVVPTVRALVLFRPDLGLRYVWTADADLFAIRRDELGGFRGFPEYKLREISQVRLRKDLAEGFYIDAVYRVLTFEDAYIPLRDSLVSLLAFAFLTVLVALALGRSVATREDAAVVRPAGEDTPSAPPSSPPETHDPRRRSVDPESDLTYEEIPIAEIATDPGEPGTLFNPLTGLSYRQHLERRLGLELERAAYNDQDLTSILIRFPGLAGTDAYVERSKQILGTFQFEDLCFEYDQTSFCIVLPSTELPQGMRQAESFRARHPDCHIGLSARNGRLVESSRLLTETARSLTHAAGEKGGIVGFRPDPRKYRRFVTEHVAGQE